MIDVSRAGFPRTTLQIPEVEDVIEQLRLVQPGGMSRCQSGSPPTATGSEILPRGLADVAGSTVVDQVNPSKATVAPSELLQGRDVMIGVVGLEANCLHLARVDDQKRKDVHGAMSDIVEFLLFDRSRDGASDGNPLQDLAVGHFVGAHHPDSAPGQPFGLHIAPEHLLRPLLELEIDAACPPVPCPMRLQVDGIENPPDRSGTDRRDNAVGNRLARQILTTPVRDVQSSGHGLQTGQRDDLSPLEGGKS